MRDFVNVHLGKQDMAKCIVIIFLMSLYFVIEANNHYWQLVPLSSSVRIGSLVFFISCIFFYALQLFIHKKKALLITCWLGMHYLFFGIIYKNVGSVNLLSTLKHYKYYLPFLLVGIIFFVLIILKLREKYLVRLFSYTAVLLSIFLLVEIGRSIFNIIVGKNNNLHFTEKVKLIPTLSPSQPDVFLIVLDEYSGNHSLKSNYGFNNEQFLDGLRRKGFFVAKKPKSNYNGTIFSVLSLLNMSYLDTTRIGDLKSPEAYAKIANEISTNYLFDFFINNRYKVFNNSFLRMNKVSSKPYLVLPIEDRLIIEKTFGYTLTNNFMLNIKSNKIQQMVGTFYADGDLYNQNAIKKIKDVSSDTISRVFIYTHLMMPHSPYLRDEHGRLRSFAEAHDELMKKKYDKPYINYLKYCNEVVEGIIERIITNRANAVIVLVSDHGNRYIEKKHEQSDDFGNLIAVYSTDGNYSGFNDTVSLVNVFRMILNNQFAQNLELLSNRQVNVLKGVLN